MTSSINLLSQSKHTLIPKMKLLPFNNFLTKCFYMVYGLLFLFCSCDTSKEEPQKPNLSSKHLMTQQQEVINKLNKGFEKIKQEKEFENNPTKKNASSDLSLRYTYKINLVANTILEGTIKNSSSTTGFKNVVVSISLYSKSNEFVGYIHFKIADKIPPNSSISFKHKTKGWWPKVDHTSYKIETVEVYK